MQLLNFSENDLEQLSKFMGHTLKTHCSCYRLSDNLYQTAKVSKLLLLSASGGIEKYKGKLLDDTEIDLSPIIEQSDQLLSITDTDNGISSEPDKTLHNPNGGSIPLISQKRAPIIRQPCTIEQKNMIAQHFSNHIQRKKAPTQVEVEHFIISQYPYLFKGGKWTALKAVVYNIYSGKLSV
nr:unnamed protein product [Callosobruchus analis]